MSFVDIASEAPYRYKPEFIRFFFNNSISNISAEVRSQIEDTLLLHLYYIGFMTVLG
ncbi:hypothetical protein [Anabaena sp. CCY 9402-a]|uniref:hypothetical protein n=1 Tax=Anabaena sp. CCY 9402-a TaxID=3103867 RepID=UPI0039C67B80